jgi:hypothetical protein
MIKSCFVGIRAVNKKKKKNVRLLFLFRLTHGNWGNWYVVPFKTVPTVHENPYRYYVGDNNCTKVGMMEWNTILLYTVKAPNFDRGFQIFLKIVGASWFNIGSLS